MFFMILESLLFGELLKEFLNKEDPVIKSLIFNIFNFDDLLVVFLFVDDVSLDMIEFDERVFILFF